MAALTSGGEPQGQGAPLEDSTATLETLTLHLHRGPSRHDLRALAAPVLPPLVPSRDITPKPRGKPPQPGVFLFRARDIKELLRGWSVRAMNSTAFGDLIEPGADQPPLPSGP